jgi:hypothetical protein
MMRTSLIALAVCLSAAALKADFTYQQTSQMTGGAMYNMLHNLPVARRSTDPTVSTVIVKGNRMATINKDTASVIDLDKETITNIDFGKKQYSVVTFAQMKKAMEDALARNQARNTKSDAEMKFKVSSKATGQTKTINGLSAKEMIVNIETEVTDTKSNQSGSMNIITDSWLATVPGYDEAKNFYIRMGEKMGYLFGSGMSGMAAQAQPGMLRGFAEVSKEMAKVDGVPILQVTKMGGANMDATASSSGQQQAPAPQAQQQNNPSVGGSVAGAALGRVPGLGGFGRNRNKKEDQPQQQSQAPASGSADNGVLIETTTELSSFSNAPADTSKFEVPAGFKQVENPMARGK